MENLHQIFKTIKTIEPPVKLESVVLRSIKQARIREERRQLAISYVGLLSSGMAIFYTVFVFGQAILKSEFWSIATLALTDSGTVAKYWNEFAYSMLETFPALTLAIILIPIFALFFSISKYLNLINNKHKFI